MQPSTYIVKMPIIFLIFCVILGFLYTLNMELARLVGMCFAGIIIAFIFTFISYPMYHLSEGGGIAQSLLFILYIIFGAIIVYASTSLSNENFILGTRIKNGDAVFNIWAGLFLASTLGLTGFLVDVSFIQKSTRLLTLPAAAIGHGMTIAIYSSVSGLLVIISALVARDILSVLLHGRYQNQNSEPILKMSLVPIISSMIMLTWISFIITS